MLGAVRIILIGLIFVGLPCQAMAVTIQDMADLQLQIKKKEMTDALEKKTEKAAEPTVKYAPNVPVEYDASGDIKLVAVYGLDDDLTADVLFNGAVFSVKEKDRVAGWAVGKVSPSRIEITKKNRKKDLTLSIKPTALFPSATPGNPRGNPPLPPNGGIPSF